MLDQGKHNNASSAHSSYNKKIQHSTSCTHTRNLSSSGTQINKLNGDSSAFELNGITDPDGNQVFEDPNLVLPDEIYAPKSLILLARHGYFDVLKVCFPLIPSVEPVLRDGYSELSQHHLLVLYGPTSGHLFGVYYRQYPKCCRRAVDWRFSNLIHSWGGR